MLVRTLSFDLLSRLRRGVPALVTAAAAALALGSSACSLVSGEHEAETRFLVKPGSGATSFSGWSEITITEDPSQVTSAELMYVRIEAEDTSVTDIGFVRSITGDAKVGDQLTRVAEKSPVPRGERIVPLDLVYDGDIKQFFFEDPEGEGWTIHITWKGEVDPTFPLPADGLWVKVKVAVLVEE